MPLIRHSYRFRPVRALDLELMDLLDDEKDLILGQAKDIEALAKKESDHKACIVCLHLDKPLFVAGCYETCPGTVRVFVIPDKRIFERPKAFVWAVLLWQRWLQSRPWCNRIETVSLPVKRIDRWMRALGYLCECRSSHYTVDGRDYNLWSKVKRNGIWGT
jgi:hypothetical protein